MFIESRSGVLLLGGLGFFILAFLSNGLIPALMYDNVEQSVEEKIQEQLDNPKQAFTIISQYKNLHEMYRPQFIKHFGDPQEKGKEWDEAKWVESCAEALRLGRRVYVGEACWHCHSQFVRPVANEEQRWGPVAKNYEYAQELQRPVMFGTRRVGPDLSREGGRRGNDWHATHFFNPRLLTPNSVMPRYPWFFEGDPGKPNKRGLALITYMQFLSSWVEDYPYFDNPDRTETTAKEFTP